MPENSEKLRELIHFYNPWWQGAALSAELLADYERPIIGTLISYLDLERILIIKGPRRTGKTTLLYQLINHLLKSAVEPQRILFLSFDDPNSRIDFDEIVKAYQELSRRILSKEKEVYFFLDEVQFLKDWSVYLKKYFDKRYPIKFILSGSSASLVKKGSESLAGRTVEEIIRPFSFYEYLDYRLRDIKAKNEIDGLRVNFDFKSLPSCDGLIPYQTQIKIFWQDYLERGGFPHLFKIKENILWQKLLREDVLEKVIYRDIVELYQIKKPFVLESMFLYLAQHSAELLNISNLANSLKLSREYTERYLDYLRQNYLIFRLRRFSSAVESQMRKMEKCYLADPGLMQLSVLPDLGRRAETAVACQLQDKELYYHRNHYEVDLILKTKKGIIPIEVKYKNEITNSELKGLLRFLGHSKIRQAIVVTRDILKEEKLSEGAVLYLPAWLFALLV